MDPINAQMIVEPNVILSNSNHSTGPSSSSSSSTSANNDHKMVPAAIGSERKRHMPIPTTAGPIPVGNASDWSSVAKRKSGICFFLVGISSSFQNHIQLIHIYNSSNKFHHHLNISNHRRAIIHDRRKKMKYFYSIETIMRKFCLLLFKDFVFFYSYVLHNCV